MKKSLIIFLAVMLMASVCFAQQATPPAAEQSQAQPPKPVQKVVSQAKEFLGKVASVTIAEPAKGIAKGSITVVDDMGNTANFTVTSATKVFDTTLNALTLNQLKEGEKVKVKHIKTKEGSEEAKAISVM
jgi:ABC-type transport system substrate-binding protein